MNVSELYNFLNGMIPCSLSCEWDNDGLMCCPDGSLHVKRVLVTLDVTEDAIKAAKDAGCNVILSHHPLIFKGIKSVNEESNISRKVIELVKSNIAAMSFHTRLDAVTGGVNDVLAARLGIRDTTPFGVNGEEIGRIGTLDAPMELGEFASLVKKNLNAPTVSYADSGKPVHRVAVLGGSGSDDIFAAIAAGADTFVSGELKYHDMTDAPEYNVNLIEAGHFYTEFPVCDELIRLVQSADPSIECIKFFSDKVRVI